MNAAVDYCIHDLDPAWCADCQRIPGEHESVTAVASFRSDCPACDEPVLAGELIVLVDPDAAWVHSRCTEDGGAA